MQFTYRNIRCSKAGFTQEQALESLYSHPNFDAATMQVMAIRQAGQHWVAKLKVAEFPPSDDEGAEETETMDDVAPPKKKGPPSPDGGDSEGGSPDGGDSEGAGGPPGPDGAPGGDPHAEGGKGGELHHLMTLVMQIADKLGIGGEPGMPGAEDPSLAGMDAPPGAVDGPPMPPHPGPHGPHGGAGAGPAGPPAKPPLRPGMTPPGVTPISTPAFASVQERTAAQAAIVGRVASFTATETTDMPFKQAREELLSLYAPHGYDVKQLREDRNEQGQRVVHALLAR